FGPYAKNIYAVETGLSSNPAMNWRIAELDNRTILSFSDAHSGPKLGREATVFDIPETSYEQIYMAISTKSHIAYTLEFYPEEGKYHYTGHRTCGIRWSPEETKQKGKTCPVCGKPLTIGVMHRVEDLAGRSEDELQLTDASMDGILARLTRSAAFPNRPPFVMLVPLQEIIAEAVGSPVASPKVQTPYFRLTDELGGEFPVLLCAELSEIARVAGARVAQGIDRVRHGNITIDPGYDGVFGTVKIWSEGEDRLVDPSKEQLTMFF
ncbi:MAG: endonuclease Q family protein, partial [Patescibacteria group bacterium]